MFALIPIIGPLISGVSAYLQSRNELKIKRDKNDLEEIRRRLEKQRNDARFQLQQDMIVFPVAAWTFLYVWDKIWANRLPSLVSNVRPIGEYELMAALPTVVLAYLFGLSIRNLFSK